MNLRHISIRVFVQCLLLLLASKAAKAMEAERNTDRTEQFIIIPESQAYTESFGMVMVCPAHAHGTPDEAFEKLKNILQQRPSERISSIWVCKANQLNTLKQFAPLVDRIVVNPYAHTSDKKPAPDDLIWPAFDHPVVNQLRELRANASDKQLVACIDLQGEPILFAKRQASFEEIQWMVYAAIGANFQGVTWRGNSNALPWPQRLRQLENKLRAYDQDLGKAAPVGWVTASGKEPVAATCSENMLFVVLLNPDYLVAAEGTKTVRLPLESLQHQVHLTLKPPAELNILSGQSLSGKPLLLQRDEEQVRLDYRFAGSSEILVFQLSAGSSPKPVRSVSEFGDYASFKKKLLTPYEANYLKLATAHQQDPALQSLGEQLNLIDEVVARLIRILRPFKVTSLDSLLGGVSINPPNTSLAKNQVITTSALDVLFDYQDLFARQQDLPAITEQEQGVFGEYYKASLKAAQDYIAEQTCLLTITREGDLGHILPVSVVIQFLHITDGQWSLQDIESLPKWMQQSEYLKILEEFSLQARRPLTAYQFALYQGKLNGGAIDKFDYLANAATGMINSRDYHAGISCLKAGIAAACDESKQEVQANFRLELTEALQSTGQVQLAADQTKQAMDEFPQSPHYGRAAALRLKYLYEMSRFADILQEAPRYQGDDRCKDYLPQILYTSWVAHRHEKHLETAEALGKSFLSRFPDHPLGVHIHFAAAMDALAASDYDEALRLLNIIEQLYPNAGIMPKVKEIKDRLEKLPATSASD